MVHSIPRYDYITGSLLSIASNFDALVSILIARPKIKIQKLYDYEFT